MQPIYWGLIGLAVVAYIGVRVVFTARARVSSLQRWAELNGYTFRPEQDASIGPRYAALTRLSLHQNGTASNLVRGTFGKYTFCAFDFVDLSRGRGPSYKQHSPPKAISFAVVVVETNLDLPPVVIERETLSAKVEKAFGATDIQFGDDIFDRRFIVRSPNRARTISVLGPTVRQLLIDTPLFEFSSALEILELHGPFVFARSRSDQFFTEDDYPQVLEFLSDILKLMEASLINVPIESRE